MDRSLRKNINAPRRYSQEMVSTSTQNDQAPADPPKPKSTSQTQVHSQNTSDNTSPVIESEAGPNDLSPSKTEPNMGSGRCPPEMANTSAAEQANPPVANADLFAPQSLDSHLRYRLTDLDPILVVRIWESMMAEVAVHNPKQQVLRKALLSLRMTKQEYEYVLMWIKEGAGPSAAYKSEFDKACSYLFERDINWQELLNVCFECNYPEWKDDDELKKLEPLPKDSGRGKGDLVVIMIDLAKVDGKFVLAT